KIVWAAENGYDAVIQENTFDPAVDGGRQAVRIPVIGPLRISLHVAAALADRIGIIVPLASHIPYVWRLLRGYGMENFVSGIQPFGSYDKRLDQRKAELLGSAPGLIKGLVEGGAEITLPLGASFIPYVVSPAEVEKATGIPVLNTTAIAVNFA